MSEKKGGVSYSSSKDEVAIDNDSGIGEEQKEESFFGSVKRMPTQTWLILWTELCERFSYYGIKTVLVLFLNGKKALNMSYDMSKAYYHAFSMLSYFTGVFGAMMADSFLGKYKTIFWSLLVYCAAEIILTMTTWLYRSGSYVEVGPLVGLFLMAIAGGNIKPCVAAFGGDQLDQKETTLISRFFSFFYMSVNVGAMLTMIIIPFMRTDIKCFGGDCYAAVFGFNAIVLILGTVSFGLGSNKYNKKAPEGNMLIRVCGIIKHALTQKAQNKKNGMQCTHWLDNAQDKYTLEEINDVKAVLRVLKMYIPLPVFWALFHQQGSSWTLQAEQMDGDLGGFQLRSDHMQFFNPILVLILIPLFDSVIYPFFERCRMPLTPLKRLVCGMLLAAIAFGITGFLQIKIQSVAEPPSPPTQGSNQAKVDFFNVSPCENIVLNPKSFFKVVLPYGQQSGFSSGQSGMRVFEVEGENCYSKKDKKVEGSIKVELKAGSLMSVYIDLTEAEEFTATTLPQVFPKIEVKKAQSGVRVVYVPSPNMTNTINITYLHIIEKEASVHVNNFTEYNADYQMIKTDEYRLLVNNGQYKVELPGNMLKLGTFGCYTVVLKRPKHQMYSTKLVGHIFTDLPATSVPRLIQLPQYIIITAGEVMFSVTGLEFAYSQSPQSMKSVMQSMWLVTTAFGDCIVMILSIANPFSSVEEEMFAYGGIMVVVAIIFAIMSYFYTYSDFSGRNKQTAPKPADEDPNMEPRLNTCDSTSQL